MRANAFRSLPIWTTVACVMAVVLASVGCSAETPTVQASTSSVRAEPVNPAVKLVIDGKDQSVQGTPSCSDHSAGRAISVGDEPNDVFIRLIPWNSPLLVGEVSFGAGFTGSELSYDGKGDGSDISHSGDSYTIRGDAVAKTTAGGQQTQPFELKVTCSY